MENDNLQRVGDVVISNNEDGNKRHNASDGKFAKKETGDGSVAKELSNESLNITEENKSVPAYQAYLDSGNKNFSSWDKNAQQHFIDDMLVMPYFEEHFLPQVMAQRGYVAYRNMSGTPYDIEGVDYMFLSKDGTVTHVDLKNVNSSFNSKGFMFDDITLRAMQTVRDKETGELKVVNGYLFNNKHKDDFIYYQMLNAGMDLKQIGQSILDGKDIKISKHSFFTVNSIDLKKTIFESLGGKDVAISEIKQNIEKLKQDPEYFKGTPYATKNPAHFEIPIVNKIGSAVPDGARIAYDISFNKKGKIIRITSNLLMKKNLAASPYAFKTAYNFTRILK